MYKQTKKTAELRDEELFPVQIDIYMAAREFVDKFPEGSRVTTTGSRFGKLVGNTLPGRVYDDAEDSRVLVQIEGGGTGLWPISSVRNIPEIPGPDYDFGPT